MAVSQWKLIRMEVSEVNIFKDAEASNQLPTLDRLWQAECRLERSFSRAQRELQRLQASRPQPDRQPEEPAPAPEPVAEEAASAAVASPTAEQVDVVLPAQPAAAAPSEIRNQPGSYNG